MDLQIKSQIKSVSDLEYNNQMLEQFQMHINNMQELKDSVQIQMDTLSLSLLRKYILEYPKGVELFNKLIKLKTDINIEYNDKTDWLKDSRLTYSTNDGAIFRSKLKKEVFIHWTWDLVKLIHKNSNYNNKCETRLQVILDNRGFVAQMGIDNIEDTISKVEQIYGEELTKETKEYYRELYRDKNILYSYLSIPKEFIIMYQDELDWNILQQNPQIHWDLELIRLFLHKCDNFQITGSLTMYKAISSLINERVVSDIKKLYTN